MSTPIISMSPDGKSEYCCNIIRVGTLEPIDGSDFLAKTYINGDSIVVRKDQISEGDIFLYASNECALSKKFLSANNLFEIGCAELNSNAGEVKPLLEASAIHKVTLEEIEKKIKKLRRARRLFENKQDPEIGFKKGETVLKEAGYAMLLPKSDMSTDEKVKTVLGLILNAVKGLNERKVSITKQRELIVADAKKKVGFFNKHGRVRCIRLKGVPSYGFIFSKAEVVKAFPEFDKLNLEEHLGEDFDTVCGELFVKAYVPPVQPQSKRSGSGRRDRDYAQKRANSFDRMIPGEFMFHYDTQPLGKNIWKLEPNDNVIMTVKMHGSSAIFSNIKTKFPIKLNIFKKTVNMFCRLFRRGIVYPEYYVDYAHVYSSRKVIKNKDINPNKGADYYSSDIWGYWAQIINPFIPQNMTLYGEICGYTPDGKYIQDKYDYGCQPGESKLMPYRISVHNPEDDTRTEWDVEDVYNWTVELMNNHPELQDKIIPIDILYHGQFSKLYPKIKVNADWHDNVLHTMAEDHELFGMEELEPMCSNPVPREGLVIRMDGDKYPEAFKLKTDKFREFERKQVDAGIVDSEMAESYEDVQEEETPEN